MSIQINYRKKQKDLIYFAAIMSNGCVEGGKIYHNPITGTDIYTDAAGHRIENPHQELSPSLEVLDVPNFSSFAKTPPEQSAVPQYELTEISVNKGGIQARDRQQAGKSIFQYELQEVQGIQRIDAQSGLQRVAELVQGARELSAQKQLAMTEQVRAGVGALVEIVKNVPTDVEIIEDKDERAFGPYSKTVAHREERHYPHEIKGEISAHVAPIDIIDTGVERPIVFVHGQDAHGSASAEVQGNNSAHLSVSAHIGEKGGDGSHVAVIGPSYHHTEVHDGGSSFHMSISTHSHK